MGGFTACPRGVTPGSVWALLLVVLVNFSLFGVEALAIGTRGENRALLQQQSLLQQQQQQQQQQLHVQQIQNAGGHEVAAKADGDPVQGLNSQSQLVTQKLYYSSLANFWSTIFIPSPASPGGDSGSLSSSSPRGASSPSSSGSSGAAAAAATGAHGASSNAAQAARSSPSSGLPGAASSSSSSSSFASGGHTAPRRHVAPSYIVLISVVVVAVFVAMVMQYALRRVEAMLSDEMSPRYSKYRHAVHSLYQQVVAVTLLCGAGIALSNSPMVVEWSASGEVGDLQALLVDVTVFLAFTAFIFLVCALALVAFAFGASKRWREWEDESRYPDNIVWRFAMSLLKREGVMDTSLQWHECASKQLVDVDMEALGFLLLRTEFVPFVLRTPSVHYRNNRYWYFPRKRDCSALDFHFAHFDFELYLSHKFGHLLAKLLQLPLSTWLTLELLIVLICLPSYATPGTQLVLFIVLGFSLLACAAALANYQRNCYDSRVRDSQTWHALENRVLARSPDSGELMWNKDHSRREGQFKLISDLMAIMMRKSGDGYVASSVGEAEHFDFADWEDDEVPSDTLARRSKKQCSACSRALRSVVKGALLCTSRRRSADAAADADSPSTAPRTSVHHLPHFSIAAIRVVLLLTAVYCSVLIAAVGAFALSGQPEASVGAVVAAAVGGLIPPPCVVWLLSRAMHYNVLLAATGQNRDDGLLAEVVDAGKAKMSRCAKRVLDAMVFHEFSIAKNERQQQQQRRRRQPHRGGGRQARPGRRQAPLRRRSSTAASGSDSDQGSEQSATSDNDDVDDHGHDYHGHQSARNDDFHFRSASGFLARPSGDDDGDDDESRSSRSSSSRSSSGFSGSGNEDVSDAAWSLTFDRLARYPSATGVGENALTPDGSVYERRVRWPEFHAWYRRWMCRSDVPVAPSRIYDTFFRLPANNRNRLGVPTYAQVVSQLSESAGGGAAAAAAAPSSATWQTRENALVQLEAGTRDPQEGQQQQQQQQQRRKGGGWGSLSRRQFQRVFDLRRQVEEDLRSNTASIEQALRRLYTAVETFDNAAPAASTEVAPPPPPAAAASQEVFLSKKVFLAITLHQLGTKGDRGATRAQVAVQDELSSFFDEADATMEGFVSVRTLAQVLHRYWYWPDRTAMSMETAPRRGEQ